MDLTGQLLIAACFGSVAVKLIQSSSLLQKGLNEIILSKQLLQVYENSGKTKK
jgi:hypothetical protein